MKRILFSSLALTVALVAAAVAGAQANGRDDKMNAMGSSMKSMSGMTGMSHTFKIHPQNGSGESGTATLTQAGDNLKVKLTISGGKGDQPAHIHKGTCAKLDPKPAYPLTTVMGGTSSTTVKDLKLSSLTSGTYAINVHKSTTDLKDYVACGDLTVASSK